MRSWGVVFLARHGQTQWNLQGRRQGRLDSPLTRTGVEQANRHAVVLRGRGIDGIFTSPLGRAVTTAQIIGDTLGVAVVVIDELTELDHGAFSGLTDAQIDAQFRSEWQRRAADKYGWRFPGGERYADADVRAGHALDQIGRRRSARPLIVAHEMIGRMLQRHLLGLDPHAALAQAHPNHVVYQIDPRLRQRRDVR